MFPHLLEVLGSLQEELGVKQHSLSWQRTPQLKMYGIEGLKLLSPMK